MAPTPMIEARLRLPWPGFTLDVDLQLPGRGVTALFGHSGSGKTTLLRCVAGLERAPQGRLVVGGECWQDARQWRPVNQRPIGYVFQEASLFPHLSVLGNLRYGLRRSPGLASTRLDQAIALLGIEALLPRRPDRLSGGERQRVGIARALALDPRLLLMDEPLAALDAPRKREILPYLERLHAALDIPVLYVSHAPEEVARLADHLVVMDRGRVRASGPLAETLSRIDQPLPLGDETGSVLQGVVGAIDTRWHLVRVDLAPGTGCGPAGAPAVGDVEAPPPARMHGHDAGAASASLPAIADADGGVATAPGIWARDPGLPVGRPVRVRVLARDVSLASQPGTGSIQNVLPGRVEALGDDEHPGLTLVRVRVGGHPLLARLTRRSAALLGLAPGLPIWVQIKSVALLE